MERDRLQVVNQCIRDAAEHAAAPDGLSAMLIERFLRTGEETWEGAGSGRFSLAQFKEDGIYAGDENCHPEPVRPSREFAAGRNPVKPCGGPGCGPAAH